MINFSNYIIPKICNKIVDYLNNDSNDDMFKNGEFWYLQNRLPECAVVFDVGANVGEWCSLALKLNPNLLIHCFEPCKNTYAHLKNRFDSSDNVIINQIALGSNDGITKINVYNDLAGTNSIIYRDTLRSNNSTTESIKECRLDSYCIEQSISEIDLLKIDVEGFELEVLKGATNMLKSGRIKSIQFEYGGTYIDANIFFKTVFN